MVFVIYKGTSKCKAGEFRCGIGNCISNNSRCDGEDDCEDGKDERDCRMYFKFHITICSLAVAGSF